MRTLLILLITFILACHSTSKKQNDNHPPESTSLPPDADFSSKMDSAKWLYYALNYNGKALFFDSTTNQKVRTLPVECDIRLENKSASGDSILLLFSFVKEPYRFLYLDGLAYTNGIGIVHNHFYPIMNHLKLDIFANSDSVTAYLAGHDLQFRNYLQNYKGELGSWLKQEIEKRKK